VQSKVGTTDFSRTWETMRRKVSYFSSPPRSWGPEPPECQHSTRQSSSKSAPFDSSRPVVRLASLTPFGAFTAGLTGRMLTFRRFGTPRPGRRGKVRRERSRRTRRRDGSPRKLLALHPSFAATSVLLISFTPMHSRKRLDPSLLRVLLDICKGQDCLTGRMR
jgi:hypothetical protein